MDIYIAKGQTIWCVGAMAKYFSRVPSCEDMLHPVTTNQTGNGFHQGLIIQFYWYKKTEKYLWKVLLLYSYIKLSLCRWRTAVSFCPILSTITRRRPFRGRSTHLTGSFRSHHFYQYPYADVDQCRDFNAITGKAIVYRQSILLFWQVEMSYTIFFYYRASEKFKIC